MSLTIKPVMKEASQSMAPLPTKPTMVEKEAKEDELVVKSGKARLHTREVATSLNIA